MKFFMIEWWNRSQGKYMQEYFWNFSIAASRYTNLLRDVEESNPDISTLHMEDGKPE